MRFKKNEILHLKQNVLPPLENTTQIFSQKVYVEVFQKIDKKSKTDLFPIFFISSLGVSR
jgi:hypothetical protein